MTEEFRPCILQLCTELFFCFTTAVRRSGQCLEITVQNLINTKDKGTCQLYARVVSAFEQTRCRPRSIYPACFEVWPHVRQLSSKWLHLHLWIFECTCSANFVARCSIKRYGYIIFTILCQSRGSIQPTQIDYLVAGWKFCKRNMIAEVSFHSLLQVVNEALRALHGIEYNRDKGVLWRFKKLFLMHLEELFGNANREKRKISARLDLHGPVFLIFTDLLS